MFDSYIFQILEQISILAAALSLADVSCTSPTSLVAVYKCVIFANHVHFHTPK